MNKKYKTFCDKKKEDPSYHTELFVKDVTTPITILLGPNGTGKSMSTLLISEELKKNNICRVTYSNKQNDIVSTSIGFEIEDLACAFHSEGERIDDSIQKWGCNELVKELLTHEDEVWAIIDELDSGLSIDRLRAVLVEYLGIIHHEKKKHPDRIFRYIFTCNSYEMLELFKAFEDITKVIWVPTKEVVKIGTYEQFKKRYIEYFDYMFKEDLK